MNQTSFTATHSLSRRFAIGRLIAFFTLIAAFFALAAPEARAQSGIVNPCTQAIGSSNQIGSIINPVNVCQPAKYDQEYRIGYSNDTGITPAQLSAFQAQVQISWDYNGDRTITDVIPLNAADLLTGVNLTRTHTYPAINSSCSYVIRTITLLNGQECADSEQLQFVSSWAPDSTNGDVLIRNRPPQGGFADYGRNIVIEVCEGVDVDVPVGVLSDISTLNCLNDNRLPNSRARERRVVYNPSGSAAMLIPGVTVNSVPVGSANADYVPDGFQPLNNPVTSANFRGATFQRIQAPGGFGAGFPQAGDEFVVRLDYWNVCNPRLFQGQPSGNNPVSATATIRIIDAPPPPTVSDTLFCAGGGVNDYFVGATAPAALATPFFRWFRRDTNPPGFLADGFGTSRNSLSLPFSFFTTPITNATQTTILPIRVTVSGGATGQCASPPVDFNATIYPVLAGGAIFTGANNRGPEEVCPGSDPPAFGSQAATGGASGPPDNAPLQYQWQQSTDNATWTDITGATMEAFDPPVVNANIFYRRRVRSVRNFNAASLPPNVRGAGLPGGGDLCRESFSNVFEYTIPGARTPGSIGVDQTVCFGGAPATAINNITAPTGVNIATDIQWESTTTDPATGGGAAAAVVAGATGLTYTPPASLANTTWYRRTIPAGGCAAAGAPARQGSNWVRVLVNRDLDGGMVDFAGGVSGVVCAGGTPPGIINTTAATSNIANATITYQWRSSATQGGPYTDIVGQSNVAGFTPTQAQTTAFYVRQASSNTCVVNSNELEVRVSNLPQGAISGGGAQCGPTAAPNVTITVSGGTAPWNATYRFTPTGGTATTPPAVNIGTAGDLTGTHPITSPAAGQYELVSVTSADNCAAPTTGITGNPVAVTSAAANTVAVTSLVADPAACDAAAATVPPRATLTMNPAAVGTYSIAYRVGAATVDTQANFTSDANGVIHISVPYTAWNSAPGQLPLTLTSVTSVASGCAATLPTNASTQLRVNPVPVITAGQQKTICSGERVNYAIAMTGALPSATTFSWTRNGMASSVRADATLHITDILTNHTTAPTTVVYSVTPTATQCAGQPVNVSITVNPAPLIRPGQQAEVCSNALFTHTVNFSNQPVGTVLKWTDPTTGISSNYSSNFIITSQQANSNTNGTDVTVHYLLEAAITSLFNPTPSCFSPVDTLTVVVHPVPQLAVANTVGASVCTNQPVNFSIALAPAHTPANTFFVWPSPITGQNIVVSDGMPNTTHINDSYATAGLRTYTVIARSSHNCESTPQSIPINVLGLPQTSNRQVFVCEGTIPGSSPLQGTGSGTTDLTTLYPEITGLNAVDAAAQYNFAWFRSYNSVTQALSSPISPADVSNHVVTQDEEVFVSLSRKSLTGNAAASCQAVAQVDIFFEPIPNTSAIIAYGTGTLSSPPNVSYSVCMSDTEQHIFAVRAPVSSSSTRPLNTAYTWTFNSMQGELIRGSSANDRIITLRFPVTNFQPISGGQLSVVETRNGCPGQPVSLTINTENIVQQPVISGRSLVCAGTSGINYRINGAPGQATFTWRLPTGASFVPNTITNGSNISVNFSSATSQTTFDIDTLSVIVRGGAAQCVAPVPAPLAVTVVRAPAMNNTTATICSGSTASSTVTLSSTGGPVGTTYNWRVSNIVGSVGGVQTGNSATGASATVWGGTANLTNTSGAVASVEYTITPVGADIQHGGNSCLGSGAQVVITVNPEPTLVNPQARTVCSDANINHEILLNPRNLPASTVFSWPAPSTQGATAGTNVANGVSGNAHINDMINNVTNSPLQVVYRVTPATTALTPNCTGQARDITITVNPEPRGADATADVCSNATLNYSLQDNVDQASGGTGLQSSFRWYANADNPNVTGETLAANPAVGGKTTSSIDDVLINRTGNDQVVTYTVVPTYQVASGDPVCPGNSFQVAVTVHPEPVGQDATAQICSDTNINYDLVNNLTQAGSGLTANVTFTWTASTNPRVTITPSATATLGRLTDQVRNITTTEQTVVYTVIPESANNCNGQAFKITVEVSPEPTAQNRNITVCSGTPPNYNLQDVVNSSGNRLNSSFSWVAAMDNPSLTGETTTTASTSSIIDDTLGNVTGASSQVTYNVTPSAFSSATSLTCNGKQFSVTVTVNPEPVAAANLAADICSSVRLAYDLQTQAINSTGGNSVSSTFTWQAANNANVSGELTTMQATSSIADLLVNTTLSNEVVNYTVTPTSVAGKCQGANFALGITVKPQPVGYAHTIIACSGSALNYNLQIDNINNAAGGGNSLSSTFIWQATSNTQVTGESVTPMNTSTINDQITNQQSSLSDVVYVVTPTSSVGNCAGTSFQITARVYPAPVSRNLQKTLCSGASLNEIITNGVTNNVAATYVWKAADNPNVTGETTTDQTTTLIADALENKSNGDQVVTYTVTPTSVTNTCQGANFTIVATVYPEPVGAARSESTCSDVSLAYDLQNNINTLGNSVISTFKWRAIANVQAVSGESTVEQTTVTIADQLTNVTSASANVIYEITPTSRAHSCQGDPFQLTATVNPEPNAPDVNSVPLCDDVTLAFDLANHLATRGNNLSNVDYSWLVKSNVTDVVGETLTSTKSALINDNLKLAANVLSNQTITYTVTPSETAHNCVGDDFSVVYALRPKPIGLSEATSLCSNSSLSFSLPDNIRKGNSFTMGTSYTWYAAPNTNVTGVTTNVQPSSTANLNDRLVNTSTTAQTLNYKYVAQNTNGCSSDTVAITVTLQASPIVDPTLAAKSICSFTQANANQVNITLATANNSVAAAQYNITASSPNVIGFSGTPTTGNGLAANAILSDSYTNVSPAPIDVVYKITPISAASIGACSGPEQEIHVTVNPKPVLNSALNKTVCSGEVSSIKLANNGSSVVADSYNITSRTLSFTASVTSDPANAAVGSSGGESVIESDKYVNVSNTALDATYRIVPVSPAPTSCMGDPLDIVLTVRPEPVLDNTAPSPVCSSSPINVTLRTITGGVPAANYTINAVTRSNASLTTGPSNAATGTNKPIDALKNDVFHNATTGPLMVSYQLVPISADGCLGKESPLQVIINPAPAVVDNLDAVVCNNDAVGITLGTDGGSISAATYNLRSIVVDQGLQASGANATPGNNVNADVIRADKFSNSTDGALSVKYTFSANSASQCSGQDKVVTVRVEPPIKAVPIANTVSICSDSQIDIELRSPTTPSSGAVTFRYNVAAQGSPAVSGYVLSQDNLPQGSRIAARLSNTADASSKITYQIVAVANGARGGSGCSSVSVPVDVTVEPRPNLTATPSSQLICEGVPTSIRLSTTTRPAMGGIDFVVTQVTPDPGLSRTAPAQPKTTYISGETLADTWSNSTLNAQRTLYTIRPEMNAGNRCQGQPTTIEISVKPAPTVTPVSNQSICSNTPLSIPLSFDLASSYATWTASFPNTILGVGNGTGDRIDLTPVNNSFVPGPVAFVVTPQINGCSGAPINVRVDVNPLPNVVGLPAKTLACNGDDLNIPLSSNVPGNTTFAWTVIDAYGLGAPGVFDGQGVTIQEKIDNQLGYQATLNYTVTPTSQASCVGRPAFMTVEASSIVPSITPSDVKICSGGVIQVTNATRGATSHRWYYRLQGTNDVLGETTTPSVNYRFYNTTVTNPIHYEVVYEASNGQCIHDPVATQPIAVYINPTARFDEGRVPQITGGVSRVTFANVSDPVEPTQFRYEWNFGAQSTPSQYVGDQPPQIVYSTRGPRDVSLTVVNTDAETAGLRCADHFEKSITVPVGPLSADFIIDNPLACVPTLVTITSISTGDINEWRVVDANGATVLTSNENSPRLRINSPGEYTVFLVTRNSFTGQTASLNRTFFGYGKPLASFIARPAVVFVPDTELKISNSSEDATDFEWDYGDGTKAYEQEPEAHKYALEGNYELRLVAGRDYGNGVVCRDTVSQRVVAKSGGQIRVPNAFTPNVAVGGPQSGVGSGGAGGGGAGGAGGGSTSGGGSTATPGGFNDVFLPVVQGVRTFEMQIYDRWGNLLFESKNPTVGWDGRNHGNGKLMSAGVYVFRLEVTLSDGSSLTRIGDVTLLR